MSKKSTPTATTLSAEFAAEELTAKGREFMQAVGLGQFSFFDGGIVEGEGCWGSVLSGEGFASVRSASGVMNGTERAGMWVVTEDRSDGPEAGAWWELTKLGAGVALYLAEQAPEQPETTALPADEAAAADFTAEPATEAELAADATYVATGNYNTVWVPVALLLGEGRGEVWTEKVSTMMVNVHFAGEQAEPSLRMMEEVVTEATAALRIWQKTQDRKEQTDMEKYNQNRSFLAGYGAAVAQRLANSKKMPVVAFAKDMDKALRPEALKAGAAAAKSEA